MFNQVPLRKTEVKFNDSTQQKKKFFKEIFNFINVCFVPFCFKLWLAT